MKSTRFLSTLTAALLFTGVAHAASWQDTLSSAASELSKGSSTSSSSSSSAQSGGMSLSSLTSLLGGGEQSLSSSTMNNAAGIMEYCMKQKLTSMTDAQNVKNQVLDKLGLGTQEQQKDTGYLDGLQGLLSTKNGEQLNLSNIGSTPLAEKVKTQACDFVLKQGVNFIS